MSESSRSIHRREGFVSVLGLAIGCQLLVAFVVVGFLAPLLPLLLAGATAFSPRTRSFAVGVASGAVAGVVFIVTYAIAQVV